MSTLTSTIPLYSMSADRIAPKQGLQLNLSGVSLALPLLHSAKHPTSTVLGVFLAPKESPSTTADIALPLIHREPNLTPMTELAMEHVMVYATRTERKVVGVYVSAGTGGVVRGAGAGGAGGVGRMAERVLEYVRRVSSTGLAEAQEEEEEVWGVSVSPLPLARHPRCRVGAEREQLDMSTITTLDDAGSPYTVFSSSTPTPLPTPEISKVLLLIRQDKLHRRLTDFDDHLDDA